MSYQLLHNSFAQLNIYIFVLTCTESFNHQWAEYSFILSLKSLLSCLDLFKDENINI